MMHSQEKSAEKFSPCRQLAIFFARVDDRGIPREVQTRAKHQILDAVGVALASSRRQFAERALSAMQKLSGLGEVPIFGMPASLTPRDAAVLNGLLCHGLDFDDTHMGGGGPIHITASLFPAAFSAAFLRGSSGRQLLTAFILGVEAAARLAQVAGGRLQLGGFHPTGVVNAFAAALVAGKIIGLSQQELECAQGIVVSFSSGTMGFIEDGAWTKRLQPGWAASSGITAAVLSQQGFVGVSSPYTGRFGFFNTFLRGQTENLDYLSATKNLGKDWELLNTRIKRFPACHLAHGCIGAALALAREGITPESVSEIRALIPKEVVATICEPDSQKKRPTNSYAAQFSMPYLVAATITRGQMTLAELESQATTDRKILSLADRIRYEIDPGSRFPECITGELLVTLTDGRVIRYREEINLEDGEEVTDANIVEKFQNNAVTAASQRQVQEIQECLLHIEEFEDAKQIAKVFKRGTFI